MKEMIITFDKVEMTPLTERQERVYNKIKALPKVGAQLTRTLSDIKKDDDFKWFALQAGMGKELWEEYWAVYKDTVDQKANDLFSRLEKTKESKIF